MPRTKTIFRNSAILTVQHITINLISIFVIGFIARRLGRSDYGIYSLAFAFPAVFEFLGSFGLRPLTIREIARNRENSFDYLGKVIPARVIFIGLMGITVFISAIIMNYEKRVVLAITIALLASMFELLSRIILDVFQAFEEMGKVAIRDITVRIFTALASISVLLSGQGLYSVCLVYAAGALLGLIINLFLFQRRFPFPSLKISPSFIYDNLREGSSYVVIGFASMLFTKIDVILLSKMTDNTSVGVYNASATLLYRLIFMADSVATAAFPAISQLFWVDVMEANRIFNRSFLTILLISLPVSLGGAMLSQQIIFLIYGNSYSETVKIFSIMIWSVPFMFLNTLLNYTLGAVREQKYVAKMLVINGVINVLLCSVMIYRFGPKGAAISILCIYILNFVCYWYGIRKHFNLLIKFRTVSTITISLVCLAGIVYLCTPMGIFVAIPAAALIYFLCLMAFGGKEFDITRFIKDLSTKPGV